MALFVECWYGIIAQAIDQNAGVSFCLHFNPVTWEEDEREREKKDQTIWLSVQTVDSQVTHENLDFIGRGKICGCERYLLGENGNRDLVIYRFDR